MMQDQNLALASEFLENGKNLFAKERYRDAIIQLEKAYLLITSDSTSSYQNLALEGEIQIWLANTYDVLGETSRSIAICQKLIEGKDPNVAKQANYLLTIFSAPPLSQLEDVISTLPNLNNLVTNYAKSLGSSKSKSQSLENNSKSSISANDPSGQVPVKTNNLLIWLAIITFSTIGISWGIWLYIYT